MSKSHRTSDTVWKCNVHQKCAFTFINYVNYAKALVQKHFDGFDSGGDFKIPVKFREISLEIKNDDREY